MKSNLFSKILGVGVAASTVIALARRPLVASPAAADTTKWTTINTPSWKDGVILPASDILDYDISGDDGNTIYVVAEVDRSCAEQTTRSWTTLTMMTATSAPWRRLRLRCLQVHRRRCHLEGHHRQRLAADNLPDFNGDAGDRRGRHPEPELRGRGPG